MNRIFTSLNEDYDLFKQAIAFMLTTRGIPQIYYGTEVLMSHKGSTEHGRIRSDFLGGWQGDEVSALTGEGLTEQQLNAKAYVSALLQWRKTATAVHDGRLVHFLPKNGLYVYFRFDEKQKIMIILNKNKTNTTLQLNRFEEMLKGTSSGKDILTAKEYMLKESIEVPANEPLILEIK
jgi:glycosidase